MCEEESDDIEAVAKLLEINDSIHRTIERYKLIKAGDVAAAAKIPKGTLGSTTGVGKNAANELSLIDFDPEPPAPHTSNGDLLGSPSQSSHATNVENDLLGLSVEDKPFGQTGGIALGGGISSSVSGIAAPTVFQYQPKAPIPISSVAPQPPKPNYDAFAALTSSLPTSKPATPTPVSQQQRQIASHQPHIAAADPFAILVGGGSRPGTPSSQRNGSKPMPTSSSLLDLAQNQPISSQTLASTVDDEWNFASSLPEPSLPSSSLIPVHASYIKIEFLASRLAGQEAIQITAQFSNETPQTLRGLHFQVAVEKSYSLQLRPQSGRQMAPNQKHAIQQDILLRGVPLGKGDSVKMRFKVSYQRDSQTHEEQGTVPSLGIL